MVDDVVPPLPLESPPGVAAMKLTLVVLMAEQVVGYIPASQAQVARIVLVSADMSLGEERIGIFSSG